MIASRWAVSAQALTTASALLLTLGFAGPAAQGSIPDDYGLGPRAIALGGAYTALATGPSAVYYNPAGLAFADGTEVTLGFSYASYALRYDADARSGADDRGVERQTPLSALTLGVSSRAFRRGLAGRIGFGLALVSPTRHIVGFGADAAPGDPNFFLAGERRDKFGAMPAVGIRILPWDDDDPDGIGLSFGVGLTLLADLDGEVRFNLQANAPTAATTHFALTYDVAPNLGLMLWPTSWLAIGVAYRGEISLKANVEIVVDLDGDGVSDFPLSFEAVTLFQPQQVQAGVALGPFGPVTLALDLTWYDWSAFEDPFVTIAPILGQRAPNFHDTLSPHLGVSLALHEAWTLRSGYVYRPSPIPTQRGETNLVDSNRHVLSFGLGYTWWTDRQEIGLVDGETSVVTTRRDPLSIDGFVQLHMFEGVQVRKDDPLQSGGVGTSFDAGGFIWNVGLFATFRF